MPPTFIINVSMDTARCVDGDFGSSLASSYNFTGEVEGGFSRNSAEGSERMLYAKFMGVAVSRGMSMEHALRMAQFLGNRRCLGCPRERRGDVMKGKMFCRTCRHLETGATLEDTLWQWASRPFNDMTYNFQLAQV